jgi:hypothetical protein
MAISEFKVYLLINSFTTMVLNCNLARQLQGKILELQIQHLQSVFNKHPNNGVPGTVYS